MEISDNIHPRRKETPKTLTGNICWLIEKSVHNLKHLILRNKTFIDMVFIFIYLTGQTIFLYLISIEKYSAKTLSSFFILFLLSTMAIEKSLMELRYTTFKEYANVLTTNSLKLTNKVSKLKNKQN